jgi:hypothetical protein
MKKDRIPVGYNLTIAFIKERIEYNKNDLHLVERLTKLLNEVEDLSKIDLEEYDARKYFVDDYD